MAYGEKLFIILQYFRKMIEFILIVLIIVLSCAFLNRSKLKVPGPKGLPIVGYGPFIGDEPQFKFMELSKIYGPIFKVQLGQREWLILNSKEVIHEAFITNKHATWGRPRNPTMAAMVGEKSVTFTSDMHSWKEQRIFATKALKSYGNSKMEESIRLEAEYLHAEIAKYNGKPCDCQRTIVRAVSNVACLITVSKRYDYHEKAFEEILASSELLSAGNDIAKRLAKLMHANYFRHFPGYREVYDYCVSAFIRTRGELAKYIREHKSTLVKDSTRDLMDEFLVEMSKRGANDEVFNEGHLPTIMQTVIGASSDTTTNTIRWCIVGLTTNQDMQERIFREVSAVLESRSYITMEDHLKMPFTRAYLQEIMRFCVPVPLLLPHSATEDFIVGGYKIPKGTPMYANAWSVHRSEKLFENPDEFRPERFLDAEGKFVFCDELMAFSIGVRRCPGEQLGRLEVFLFVTDLIARFLLLPDEDGPKMELGKGMSVFGFGPEVFNARFIEREKK